MKNYIVLLLLAMVSTQAAFSQTSLKGRVIDLDTGKPVDYVNIGIIDKAKGTVSEQDGSFILNLVPSDINKNYIVQFSRIGYETIQFSSEDLKSKLTQSEEIKMKESLFELEGITISNKDSKKNRIGYVSSSKRLFGFWNDSLALGGEHASKIRIKKSPLKLEDLSFNIITSISDSLLVRVNIYEIDKGLPGRNISKKNILHTIRKKRGKIIIDLSPYNIIVDNHFIVSLELLKIYGNEVGIAISAFNDGARSYTRLLSQDRWRRMRKGTTIAFNLNTSLVENKIIVTKDIKDKLREKPDEVTILWDNSYSMKGRNLLKEILFLDYYFKYLGNVTVKFQTFGYSLNNHVFFNVVNSNWKSLKNHILEIVNDGSTNPEVLDKLNIGEHTLLFTDGNRFPDGINQDWVGTVFTINSKIDGNHKLLKNIAEDSEANYINLMKVEDLSLAINYTKEYMVDNLIYSDDNFKNRQRVVFGTVNDFEDPIANVSIRIKGSDKTVLTDKVGKFKILAETGDVLEFSYPGREKSEFIVSSMSSIIDVAMPMNINVLDEVVLEEDKRNMELSASLNQSITTNFGVLDAKKTGFAMKQLKGEEMSWGSPRNVAEAIKGKFPGVKVSMRGFIPLVSMRGGEVFESMNFYAAWDVDGLLYPPTDPPIDNLNIQNIKDLTIMPGSWAAARYGRMAMGGVIIIRTKSQSFNEETPKSKEPILDQARIRNNKYLEEAIGFDKNINGGPEYLIALISANNSEEAYRRYLNRRKVYGHLYYFYIDVHNVFLTKWKDQKKANLILSNIEERFYNNSSALKALAYVQEENDQLQRALETYNTINLEHPSQQAKRNLANMHNKVGNHKNAWSIYLEYIKYKKNLDDDGSDKIVREEMLAILEENGEEIGLEKKPYYNQEERNDVTVIAEWNNPNTQFELQFVNPEGNYYKWNNALELSDQNSSTMNLSNSFAIPDISKGNWLINVKYLGNQENTPSFLKFTIRNKKKDTEIIKVLKLHTKGVNYKFLNLSMQNVSVHS